jgi:predicted PurR-regulated permease PerM
VKFGEWLGLIILLVSLYVLWQIRQLLLLIFTAVVLATELNRLSRRLQKLGMRRGWAVLVSVGVLLSFFIVAFQLIVPPFANEFQQLTLLVPQGIERVDKWFASWQTQLSPQLESLIPNFETLSAQIQPLFNQLLGGSLAIVSSSLNAVLNFLFLLVLTLMFLISPSSYRDLLILLFPSFYRRRADLILQECEIVLGNWVTGALLSMAVVAGLSGAGLLILQVRAPLANAVLAGLLNFIPNIGPTFSVIPPLAIALLDGGWKPLFVLVLYFGIQQLESSFLTPYIMSQQVALLPALTLLFQVFFATIFGFFGLVMAIPLTVVGQIWVREVLIRDVLDQWQSKRSLSQASINPPSGNGSDDSFTTKVEADGIDSDEARELP